MAGVNEPDAPVKLTVPQRRSLAREQGPTTEQQTTGVVNWQTVFTIIGQPGSQLDIPFSKLYEMRRDPMIRFGLQYIKVPLIRAPWYIKCEDAQVAAFCDAALRQVYGTLILAMTNALDFGYSPIEKRFELASPSWTYEDPSRDDKTVRVWDAGPVKALILKPPVALPPETCVPRWKDSGEFDGFTWSRQIGVMQNLKTRGTDVVDVDHALWFTNERDTVFGSLYGYPRIAYSHRYWWSYWFRWALADRAFEKHADPALMIYYPDDLVISDASGNQVSTRSMAMVMGEAIRSGSTVTLPNQMMRGDDGKFTQTREWEVKALELQAQFEEFARSFEYLDTAKLRSLMIPEKSLIEANGGGGYNVASEMGDLFYESQAVLMAEIDDQINRFILPQLVAANFPDRKVDACKVTRGFAAQDQTLAKQLVQLIGQADPSQLGIDTREILRQAGVPILSAERVAKDQEKAAKMAAAQQAGPEGAPGSGFPPGMVQMAPAPPGNPQAQGGNPQDQLNSDTSGQTSAFGFADGYPMNVVHPSGNYANVVAGRYTAPRPVINLRLSHPLKGKFRDSRLEDDDVQLAAEALHDTWIAAYRDGYEAFARALEDDDSIALADDNKAAAAGAAAGGMSDAEAEAKADQIIDKYAGVIARVYEQAGTDSVAKIAKLVEVAGKKELASAAIDISTVKWNADNPDVVDWMHQAGGALIRNVSDTTRKELRQFIAKELQKTQTPKDIANAIRTHFAAFPGWKALRLARTEAAHAYNEATLMAGKLAGVKWVQALDASNGRNLKTDKPCIHRNGKFYRIEDAPYADLHPNGTLTFRLVPPGIIPPEGDILPANYPATGFYDSEAHLVQFKDDTTDDDRQRFLLALAEHRGAQIVA